MLPPPQPASPQPRLRVLAEEQSHLALMAADAAACHVATGYNVSVDVTHSDAWSGHGQGSQAVVSAHHSGVGDPDCCTGGRGFDSHSSQMFGSLSCVVTACSSHPQILAMLPPGLQCHTPGTSRRQLRTQH
ncbi:unnamed protein product [Chrysodeixis includens]|uniref:Uncharacterized protein n=1 Tax=Chrysodeixis includens TaxID=689277 RepID=A0A9N8L0N8_CHRIL|nr:unnamed protein product [Chrysodeixis includens]